MHQMDLTEGVIWKKLILYAGPVLLAELGDLLYHVEGVENYRLLAPAADLAAEDGTLPMLGRVTVTEMEADDDV